MVPSFHLFRFNAIVEDFGEHEQKLTDAKNRIQNLVDQTTQRSGHYHQVAFDVRAWLERTQHVLEDVRSLKSEIENNKRRFIWYPNWIWQYRLCRRVVNKMRDLEELLVNSDFDQVVYHFDPVVYPASFRDKKLYTSKSFSSAFDQIMEALKEDAVSMIAVWGMAGVGKTTLVREVARKAKDDKLFDEVVAATVSLTPDLQRIQKNIGDILGLQIDNFEVGRAEKLWLRLKKEKKILIILDDVWDGLNLKAIGIPYDEVHKGCKILLTTRCEQVCISMRVQKVIRLDILSDDEACALIKKNAGDLSDTASQLISDAAIEIAKECQGLALATVALGRSLRHEDLNEWKKISQILRSPTCKDVEFFLFSKIICDAFQLSYGHLKKRTTKLCFLLCSLFPKDYAIDVEVLTRYAWGLGLYENIDSINKVRCEVWAAIENLISSCLLLDNGERRVKMHNLARLCALRIASRENISFIKEWGEVEDLPERCLGEGQPEILSLDGSGCRRSPSARMQGMKSLKVFTLLLLNGHLSASALENLTNLRTLHVVCCQLYDISSLGKLDKLEILSFRGSDISELPDEIGRLNYLRLLDLFNCQKLQKVPLKLIRKLSRLEELYFNCCSFEEWWYEETSTEGSKARPSEPSEIIPSCSLPPSLQTYEIAIKEDGSFTDHHKPTSRILRVTAISLDTFNDLFHLNHVMEKQPAIGGSEKKLRVEDCNKPQVVFRNDGLRYNNQEDNPTLVLSNSTLELIELPRLTCIWYGPTDHLSLRSLKVAIIKDCRKLTSLFSFSLAKRMELLEKLEIDGCHALKQITTDTYTLCLPRLVTLEITDCDLLEYVFRITRASFAPQLRVLNVSCCPRLNRVIEVTNKHIELPQLQSLALKSLESLTTFCSGEFSIRLPSLEELKVEACPQLSSICEIVRQSQVKDLCLFNVGSQLCEEIIHLQGGYFLSSLEKLMLKELAELQVIFKDPRQIVTLQNLSHLKVFNCNTLRNIFSVQLARNLPHLSHLEVEECKELEQVVAQDEISSSSMASQKAECFPNLEKVCIMKCNKLRSLFPVSFSRLPNLKGLQVKGASNLREIFGHDSDANMTKDEKQKEVLLPKLEELVLENLPNLIWFATVGYYFVFPALISLKVTECPRIIMRFSNHDHSEGSYVRAEIEKSLLPKEGDVESSIGMQIIKYNGDGKNIAWVHPTRKTG